MNYRHLGSAGLVVSELSFGAWVTFAQQIGDETATECMKAAFEAGVNLFDNAESYAGGEAESMMGRVIRKCGWAREELVITTKLFWGLRNKPNWKNTLNRKYLLTAIDGSLERLQMDYVDLLFCHRPDPDTPTEETVRAMSDIVSQGKALYWGTSEWSADQILQAHALAERHHLHKPQMEQPQYNMFHRARVEKEYGRLYREIGLGLTTWSPLASGVLTGKYSQGIPAESRGSLSGYEWLKQNVITPERVEKAKQLAGVAADLGCPLAQLSIAWCLKNPNVSSVITGASRAAQVRENMKSLDVVPRLTPEVMTRIEDILSGKS